MTPPGRRESATVLRPETSRLAEEALNDDEERIRRYADFEQGATPLWEFARAALAAEAQRTTHPTAAPTRNYTEAEANQIGAIQAEHLKHEYYGIDSPNPYWGGGHRLHDILRAGYMKAIELAGRPVSRAGGGYEYVFATRRGNTKKSIRTCVIAVGDEFQVAVLDYEDVVMIIIMHPPFEGPPAVERNLSTGSFLIGKTSTIARQIRGLGDRQLLDRGLAPNVGAWAASDWRSGLAWVELPEVDPYR